MASNNRKPSPRWLSKSADDRAKHNSRTQQSGGSLHGKRKVDSKKVQETLDDMFKNVFDAEIIRSVAHSCGWDLSKSIETLIMLSEGEDSAEVKLQRISAKGALSFAVGKNQTKEKSRELSKQNVPDNLSKSANTSKTKSVMMNTSQGPIKVTYKGHDDPDISDDDADVVIEEENEIEDNSVDLTFASVASQSMCQFLTHLIPSQEVDCYSEFKNHNTDTSVILNNKSKEGSSLSIDQSGMPAKKTKHWHQFERIKKQINESIKVMVLLRGVPGSGKTSLARHIIKVTHGENYEKYVFSTDHYFVLIGKGKYIFDPKLLPDAHKWNQHRVYVEAKNGTNPILIDNTNLESWEMKPYVEIAVDYGYNIELLEPKTSWRYNPMELEKKNIHNVPRRKIEDMLLRFERDLTPGKLMTYFNLKYKANNSPPQFTPQLRNISLIQKEIALSNLRKKSKLKKGDDQKSGNLFKNKLLHEKLDARNVSLTSFVDTNEEKISSWSEVSQLNNALSDLEETKFKETMRNNSEFTFPSNEFSSFQAPASDDNSADPSFEFSDVQKVNVNEGVSVSSEDRTENDESTNDWEDRSNSIDKLSLSNVSENDVLGSKPLDKNVECTNYVLVMKDGTLLPQKSYTEEFDSPNFSQVFSRKWEYVLMADHSHLLLNSRKLSHDNTINADLQHTCEESQLISLEEPLVQSHSFQEMPGSSADASCDETLYHRDPVGESFNNTDKQQFQLLDLSENPVNIAFTGVDESASSEFHSLTNNSETDISSSTDKLGKLSETTFNTLISPIKNQMTIDVLNMNPQDHFIEAFSFQSSENNTSVQPIALEWDKYRNEHDNADSASLCDKSENSEQTDELAKCVKLIDISCDVKEPINHNFDHITLHTTTTHCQESLDKIYNDPVLFEEEVKVQSENIKDILTLWNEGNSWDDQEHNISETIKPSAFSPTPKPARLNNRRLVSYTNSEKIIDEQSIDKALESTSSGIWSVVDEPLESWEAIMNERKIIVNENITTEARPQREQFATGSQSGAQVLTELGLSEDNSRVMYDTSVPKCFNNDTPSDVADISNDVDLCKVKTEFLKMVNAVKFNENVASTSLDKFDGISEITKSLKGVHMSTNTCHLDFMVLNSVNTGTKTTDESYRVLVTSPRNIIETEQLSYIPSPRKIFPVLLLDKSSMTSDECFVTEMENFEEQLRELVHMFPSCTADDLQEIFEKCNKDINWTVDLLLESACQGVIISTLSSSHRSEIENGTQVNADSAAVKKDASNPSVKCVENESNSFTVSPVLATLDPIPRIAVTPDMKCLSEQNTKTLSSNKRNGKKDRNAPLSEESLLIKKQLEENIIINEEHYSEHVSRIRKLRHGEIADMTEVSPSIEDFGDSCFMEDTEEMTNSTAAGITQGSMQVLCPDALEWEGAGISQDIPEEEECVSLQLDPEFADQLHNLFGTATLPFSQAGMKPCLNLPLSLARQLHYYMLEAEQNSYDLMMQEDEELARKLQFQEELGSEVPLSSSNQVPDLREIMDMEMALALYKADQKQNSPDGKEDLATKLTKDLLCEWFPSLPRDILVNVFEAHNGSFEETIEVLIASTEEDNCVRTVMTPEARVAHERALLQKANLECEKSKENLLQQPVNCEKTTQEKALEDAYYYRSEASRHYKLRNECQQKAQKTFQRGLTAVAAYYSQMASLHKERIEENNAKAASSLLLAHSLGNLTTTLDLHFLYVVEALQVLDMFLDHHVNQLLESGHRLEHLFVITGRGARSSGGRSRIKPAVIQRLEQRGLRHVEVNPGLLKVTITRNTTSSTRIAS